MTTITGYLFSPTGAAMAGAKLTIRPRDMYAGASGVTLPSEVTVTANGSGFISVELIGGVYDLLWEGPLGGFSAPLSVPSSGTADLKDMLIEPPEMIRGERGEDGSSIHYVTATPGAALGQVGDLAIRNDTNRTLYEKTGSSTWTTRTTLRGPEGTSATITVVADEATFLASSPAANELVVLYA